MQQHVRMTQSVSAGVQALSDGCSSFAYTQAAWRFFRHERVTLPVLYEPLVKAGLSGIDECQTYGLVIHDWSRLHYGRHTSKEDKIQMSHQWDIGYELQSSLLISDVTGQPIAPLVQNLITSEGNHSSLHEDVQPEVAAHLDELTTRLGQIKDLGFSKPLVHLIDREADSVLHLRAWQAQGHYWLTRSRENSRVEVAGRSLSVKALAAEIPLVCQGQMILQGKSRQLWVGECDALLTRKAKPKQALGKKIAGDALPLRVIVSRVMSDEAKPKLIAEWYLLSNLPKTTDTLTLTQWYCWRWQIESLFKLLKTAGFGLENWQQETGKALAKRLAVACCACVLVWQIMRQDSLKEMQLFLVRLSGRQMKRTAPVTAPALLAGLWAFLTTLDLLAQYDVQQLYDMANQLFPNRYRQ